MTAKKTTKKTSSKAPAKAAAKKTSGTKAAKTGSTAKKKTTTKATAKATTKAPAKKAVKKKLGPIKDAAQLEEVETEDIWPIYAKAKDKKSEQELEILRNVLMERHYPLVKYIAERLLQTLPKSIELDDLVSAGLFGLMDAIRGFDLSRGIKFKTYCTTRIRGSILDQLRSQDWVPRLVRLKAGKIDKALHRLTGEYGREPTHAELAETLEMEHAELSKEISNANAKTMFSLSEKWEDRDDDSSMEKVDVL
ncbi:MAG: sigma-70 family RNA polymerase sigma factor, partial [Planctomycetota bacterium]